MQKKLANLIEVKSDITCI